MKKMHQKRLAKLALALLRNRDNVEFDMTIFRGTPDISEYEPKDWQCGTSCCFVGYAPEVFKTNKLFQHLIKDDWTNWDDVCNWLVGGWIGDGGPDSMLWQNLFSSRWSNDPVDAVRRALYALENPKEALREWVSYERHYKSFGPEKLEQRLAAFT